VRQICHLPEIISKCTVNKR